MTLDVLTFGCRLNAVESEAMRARAEADGLTDAVLVNTCAVTAEAVRQARQAIRRARRERPDAPIVVTGCAAQTEAQTFAAMPEVTRVLGNASKAAPGAYRLSERLAVSDIFAAPVELATARPLKDRVRAHVAVQTGCDHRCTFCVIPYGRGNSRSVPAGEVVAQVRALVDQGVREVVLTGVDLTSWGADLPGAPPLGRLVQRILKLVPDLPRLRLSSIDAAEIDEALLDAFATSERLMPYLHLSLQHGDDLMLKRMKRRHLRADAIAFCEQVRAVRPDVVFGADIIAGFPTETEAMFENSLRLVEDCGLTWLHVFPFSPRAGTPAARMPAVAGGLVRERAERLRAAGAARVAAHFETLQGAEVSLLMEKPDFGRTEGFAPVRLARTARTGALVSARITGATERELIAA